MRKLFLIGVISILVSCSKDPETCICNDSFRVGDTSKVYHKFIPPVFINITDTYSDFDSDTFAIESKKIKIVNYANFSTSSNFINSLNNDLQIASVDTMHFLYAKIYENNDQICQNSQWNSYVFFDEYPEATRRFWGNRTAYAAFRLNTPGGFKYGWIKIATDSCWFYSTEIISYGLEQ
jgi:hypothetical protein